MAFNLVYVGCLTKCHSLGGLYQQEMYVSYSSKVWKNEIVMPAWLASVRILFQVSYCWLLIVSSWDGKSREREASSLVFFYKVTNFIYEGSSLITSHKPHLLIASPWGSEFQQIHFEGHKHSVHNNVYIQSLRKIVLYYITIFQLIW